MPISRRAMLAASLAGAAAATARVAEPKAADAPALAHLCDLHFELQAPIRIASTPTGNRTILRVAGGRVEGERLAGKILPAGGDWATMRPDGIFELDVRATIETDDGARIIVTFGGLVRMSPANWQRFAGGDKPSADDYYFRVTPRFSAGDEAYRWLNGIVCVGVGTDLPPTPRYHVYEVL